MARESRREKRTGKVPPPTCKALLLCDGTTRDPDGKPSIIGLFNAVTVAQFPTLSSPFCIFVQLADGVGRCEVVLEVHDVREDKLLLRSDDITIHFLDRPNRVNLTIPVPAFQLEHDGAYDFLLLANGDEVERQQFTVTTPAAHSSG